MLEPRTAEHRQWATTIGLTFLVPLLVYAVLSPAVPNPDGHYYYTLIARADPRPVLLPGHLLYGPLVAFVWRVTEWVHPISLLTILRFTSHIAGALGVLLAARVARRWGAVTSGQYLAGLGLAFSSGYWLAAADIETYALALLGVAASLACLTQYADRPTPGRAAALALANAIAALFQLQLLSLTTASLCLIASGWFKDRAVTRRTMGTYLACLILALGLPYLLVSVVVLHHRHPLEAFRWLVSAGGGLTSPFDLLSIPRALYGFGRAFVFLDFFDVAKTWILVLKGSALLLAGAWSLRRIPGLMAALPQAPKRVLLSSLPFVVIHVAFGLSWYPSEVERWIFFLPLIWATLGATVPQLPAREQLRAGAAVALMTGVNLASGAWPMSTDTTVRDRVLALQRALRPGTVVVSPGFDWFDYYSFYTGLRTPNINLISLALQHRDDPPSFSRDLATRVGRVDTAGRPLALIRVFDPADPSNATPWPELAVFGHTRANLQRLLEADKWIETRLDDPAQTRLYWRREEAQD